MGRQGIDLLEVCPVSAVSRFTGKTLGIRA